MAKNSYYIKVHGKKYDDIPDVIHYRGNYWRLYGYDLRGDGFEHLFTKTDADYLVKRIHARYPEWRTHVTRVSMRKSVNGVMRTKYYYAIYWQRKDE